MKENETDMLFKVKLSEPPFFCTHCGTMPDFGSKKTPFYLRILETIKTYK